jgi:ketosteroid isomerase-like protein
VEEARRDAGLSDRERIERLHEGIAMGDKAGISPHLHPDVVWEHNLGGGSPEEGTYKGRESVIALFERILGPWEYVRPIAKDVRDAGDGTYEVHGELHAKHSTSDVEMVTTYEQRLELRDGLLVRGRMTMGPIG